MRPSLLIRQDVVPMVAGYLAVMTALGVGLHSSRRAVASSEAERGRAGERRATPRIPGRPCAVVRSWRGWPALIRHVLGTAVGGYLVLMTVVIAYYYAIAREGGRFIESAFTGNALLMGIAAPVFTAASWLAERRCGRSRNTTGQAGAPGR